MNYKKNLGIIIGVGALLVNALMGKWSSLADGFYYKGIFQIIRAVYDHTLGFLPFPAVYLLFGLLVWWLARKLGHVWDAMTSSQSIIQKSWTTVHSILNPLGYIIFAFYFLWGWNYQRTPFEQRMQFPSVTPDTSYLYNEASDIMDILITERRKLKADTISFYDTDIPSDIESTLRQKQESIIARWGEPTLGRVRIRKLRPTGTLLRIATSGVYIPFVCEGHIDAGLHSLQVPFTMAHEMAHGYGYTDEGVCNFVGFITCIESGEPMLNYAGMLGYYRYLLSNLRSEAPSSYRSIRQRMPAPIRMDLNDIADQMDKYPDLFPDVRNAVYDSYLKSHGVKKGIANYNDIVRLFAQYKELKEVNN